MFIQTFFTGLYLYKYLINVNDRACTSINHPCIDSGTSIKDTDGVDITIRLYVAVAFGISRSRGWAVVRAAR